MAERQWFGTDGIRGFYGRDPQMTPTFAHQLAQAAAAVLRADTSKSLVLIARDTRASGIILEESLTAGLTSESCQVLSMGVLPTAALGLITREKSAAFGIMVSASHNPAHDNGIKFFGPDGFKLNDATELAIEERLTEVQKDSCDAPPKPAPTDFDMAEEGWEIYQRILHNSLPDGFNLNGKTIAIDCAHGASWQTTPRLLRELGAKVHLMGAAPDGFNINQDCGSQHPEALQELQRQHPGAIGLAHDGDADRLLFIDEDGEPLDGDDLLAILGHHALGEGTLPGRAVVATVMSNLGLDRCLESAGGKTVRTAVGDRYVLQGLQEGGFTVGGEQSGHVLLLDHAPSGDGLLAALQVLKVSQATGKPLKELRQILKKFPQQLTNLPVDQKLPLEQCPAIRDAVDRAERDLGGEGRVLLRYSGTEPKIRLLIEARDADRLPTVAAGILKAIRQDLGGK